MLVFVVIADFASSQSDHSSQSGSGRHSQSDSSSGRLLIPEFLFDGLLVGGLAHLLGLGHGPEL